MKRGNKIIFGVLLSITLVILAQNSVSAATSSVICAEHTNYGAWCMDVISMGQVDTNYPYQQGACASTSFCRMGTCANTVTGTCLPAAYALCDPSQGGRWFTTNPSNTPKCSYGCCLLGNLASFTTDARCQALSSQAGVSENFNKNINSEASCLAMAGPQTQGACVYSNGDGVTCKFTTNRDCITKVKGTFHVNLLCTNPTLGTNCLMTQKTTCQPGYDQVFFMDTCGNPANVYDANNVNNIDYWSYVAGTNGIQLESTATPWDPNNGNCNYQSGSTCMQYNSTIDGSNKPSIGNNICRNINCLSQSDPFVQLFQNSYGNSRSSKGLPKYPLNGEQWCGTEDANGILLESGPGNPGSSLSLSTQDDQENGNHYQGGDAFSDILNIHWYGRPANTLSLSKTGNLPGSEDVLFTCQNGQVTAEVGYGRQKICNQSISSGGIFNAYLKLNNWRSCYTQNNSKDCMNAGDCQWVPGYSIKNDGTAPLLYDPEQNQLTPISSDKPYDDTRAGASCLPLYPPGFDLSIPGSASGQTNSPQNANDVSGQQFCNLANIICYANYTQSAIDSITGGGKGFTVDNPWAYNISCFYDNGNLAEPFTSSETALCGSIGDCGISTNYIGVNGQNGVNDLFKITRMGQSSKIGF